MQRALGGLGIMLLHYFKDSEETVSAMAWAGKLSVSFPRRSAGITRGNFFQKSAASQSPTKNCRAAAIGKIAKRRLISRIILASVVNASSRRHRELVVSRGH